MPGEIDATGGAEDLQVSLERDGYLIFDSGIAESTLDAVVADIEGEFRPESSLPRTLRRARRAILGRHTAVSHRDEVRLQDAWTISENVREIARSSRVLELLRRLFGREPRPFQTLNFRVGSQQGPHADTIHFNSDPPGFMCGVWVALEDVDEDCGPLVYYPGSHKLPEVSMGDIGAPLGEGAFPAYARYVESLIGGEDLEARYGTLRKGEALLWSSNLLHGGAPQRDPNRTRLSQVTHYFFADCRYWKPLLSNRDQREYWEPAWVR